MCDGEGQFSSVDPAFLNDLLIQTVASRLGETERQSVLAWASRLRQEGRLSCLKALLDMLMDALPPPEGKGVALPAPFCSPPSNGALPTFPAQVVSTPGSTSGSGPGSAPAGRPPSLDWAQQLLRSPGAAVPPPPRHFLDAQPRPRAGALCYMGVFGSGD